MNFKLGEFFCGPGGIALGAIKSGEVMGSNGKVFSVTPTWATDYDKDTCETYIRNIAHFIITVDSCLEKKELFFEGVS